MFTYADRLPLGRPRPDGSATPAPWGLRRLTPLGVERQESLRAEFDPHTQAVRYFDAAGQRVRIPGGSAATSTYYGGGDEDASFAEDQ